MFVRRREYPILIVNLVYIGGFTAVSLGHENYEFVLYAGVVIAVAALILYKQEKVRFDRTILWGLTFWGLMHMAGGNIRVGDGVLYQVQLIPMLLRYDQFVHFYGFGIATLVCYHLLRGVLKDDVRMTVSLGMLIMLMGCGVGALNEIVEFVAVKTVPQTGVGGYDNTLWDLTFNLLGASAAVIFISIRQRFISCR